MKHFLLHAVIGLLAGFAAPDVDQAVAFGLGGVLHMEGEDRYQGATWRASGQGAVERGAGVVLGIGVGRLLRSLIFG